MPHYYKDGRPAKVGDLVMDVNESHLSKAIGVLVSITPGSTSCNAQLFALARKHGDLGWNRASSEYTDCVTLSDLLPLDAMHQITLEEEKAPVGAGG